MSKEYSSIKLNGKPYSNKELQETCLNLSSCNSFADEQRKIFQFITEWLDNSKTILVSTSGSTGKRKTIYLYKQHMINSARLTVHFFNLTKNDTVLLCLPVEYIAGKMMIIRALVSGFNLITIPPSVNPFAKLNQPIDFVAITPQQFYHSLNDIQHLPVKKIIIGGGEIPQALESKARDLHAEVYATYGMTETCSHIAIRKVNGSNASDFYQTFERITVEKDERECLVIHAPMLSEYKIITNDIVDLYNENCFKWLGRYDHVINTGGVKVFPEKIEKKISEIISNPLFVTALPDIELSEKVVLVLEEKLISKNRKKELIKKIKGILSKYEVPKDILPVEKFRYSSTGKILRKETLQQIIKDI